MAEPIDNIDRTQGYVLMWRSIMNTAIWTNPKLFRVYSWCMMRAGFEEKEVFPTTNKIKLQPGEFIMSYPLASLELKMSVGSVKTYLEVLKAESIIETNSTNKYTVVSIKNWSELQNPERKTENKMKSERKQTETNNTYKHENTLNTDREIQPLAEKTSFNKRRENGSSPSHIGNVLSSRYGTAPKTTQPFQYHADRVAKQLGISLDAEWFGFFKNAYQKNEQNYLDAAVSYCVDYPEPQNLKKIFFGRFHQLVVESGKREVSANLSLPIGENKSKGEDFAIVDGKAVRVNG